MPEGTIKPFTGQVAVITGASDGIGRATAQRLARDGAALILVARGAARLLALARSIEDAGGCSLALAADATLPETAARAMQLAVETWGRVDILVNNVGSSRVVAKPSAAMDELEFHDWQATLAFNLDATYHFCRAAIPLMKQARRGRIVNVSSSAAKGISSTNVAYVAAKAGVTALTRKLSAELGPWNINVNAVSPSLTLTDRMKPYWDSLTEAERKQAVARIPLRRIGTAQDQANVICFLASEDAGFLTGLTLDVNGGQF
jgi:NAD(P)-dependent dehydrogenase (short-subunit alcohol dehydrogenase family)